ncbi:DNA adenine methylase [Nodosilinea sp. LEGE 07088]|uniref:DNA adenine methylase n=1 Tax=Nodosilinea sp. LEGE 07088 TaxID=2777968 RepID=UPI0018817F19|nr:DNA adenine methylase [Nodosilinea sp. LEGE 07088]MBE9136851.1 DNA adenine methylase [Nodosilinea sp. LEGE 07088]
MTAVLSTQTGLHPRPFLKWAGGKGRLLGQYEPFLPTAIDTYYEPFLGGGAVFFHLAGRMQRAVLGDINPELVNVYCYVRDQVESLLLHLWEHQRRHSVDYYYQVRQQHNLRSPLERAARLIYLNKTCYNGLYRENSQGHFNVPIGKYKSPNICDPLLLRAASAALQKAEIRTFSFETLLSRSLSSRDFVYFDPPYHPISPTSSFTSYSRYGFSRDDQQALAHVFSTLAARGQRVMLSNSDCEFIRDLYQGFNLQPILAARAINSRAGQRGKIGELLVTFP